MYAGASLKYTDNVVFSGLLSLGIGNLSGNNNYYDSKNTTITSGLSGSYIQENYYLSFSSAVSFTNFNTNRNIDFLDNPYVSNPSTKAKSTVTVLEAGIKSELGTKFLVGNTISLTPKILVSQSASHNLGYKESTSSAGLLVEPSTLLINDAGIGIEVGRELYVISKNNITSVTTLDKILESILGRTKKTKKVSSSKNLYWYPTAGLNIIKRTYKTPETEMKFIETGDEFYTNIDSANYSGILGQLYGSLLYQGRDASLQVGYNGDVSLTGYMNHSINATLKYSF